eukprot:SAG22_NODE_5204_length_1062_cov_1.993769_1_plen_280_part_01
MAGQSNYFHTIASPRPCLEPGKEGMAAHQVTLLILESELVTSKRKLELAVSDFAELVAAIKEELSIADGESLVIAKAGGSSALTTLEEIGTKAKVQVWLLEQFEAITGSAQAAGAGGESAAAAAGGGGASPEGGSAGGAVAAAPGAVDLTASVQSLERLGKCSCGQWAIDECSNNAYTDFLCLVHPVGVHMMFGIHSGGAFRHRSSEAQEEEDMVVYRDGSSKPAAQSNLSNAAPSALASLLSAHAKDPGQFTPLQPGVTYTYGDHWELRLAEDGSLEAT